MAERDGRHWDFQAHGEAGLMEMRYEGYKERQSVGLLVLCMSGGNVYVTDTFMREPTIWEKIQRARFHSLVGDLRLS